MDLNSIYTHHVRPGDDDGQHRGGSLAAGAGRAAPGGGPQHRELPAARRRAGGLPGHGAGPARLLRRPRGPGPVAAAPRGPGAGGGTRRRRGSSGGLLATLALREGCVGALFDCLIMYYYYYYYTRVYNWTWGHYVLYLSCCIYCF